MTLLLVNERQLSPDVGFLAGGQPAPRDLGQMFGRHDHRVEQMQLPEPALGIAEHPDVAAAGLFGAGMGDKILGFRSRFENFPALIWLMAVAVCRHDLVLGRNPPLKDNNRPFKLVPARRTSFREANGAE